VAPNRARDDVERWLVQDSYKFASAKTDGDSFRFVIAHTGSFANDLEIFEPAGQPGVLVIGTKCPFSNGQNARYLRLGGAERQNLENRLADHSRSIRAVHRFLNQDGKRAVGVYVVLDGQGWLTKQEFADAVKAVIEMGDKTSRYLLRSF